MFRSSLTLMLLSILLAACASGPAVPPPIITPSGVSLTDKSQQATPEPEVQTSVITATPRAQVLPSVVASTSQPVVPTSAVTQIPTQTSGATPIATAAMGTTTAATPTVTTASSRPYPFDRIFIIVFENHGAESAFANPYFKALAALGAYLANYHAVSHPSQPNYLALIGGAPFFADDASHNLPQTNLVDLLEGAGLDWRAYQENYPGNCFAGAVAGDSQAGYYARKHNPFISFDNIRTNPARCGKIVPADQLPADIAANRLPPYSFYTPNQNHDGHDRPLSFAAQWFQGFLEAKLTDLRFAQRTLVVVTFDETDSDPGGASGNHIYTLLLGAGVKPGSVDNTRYTHYSLLRTVEDNFALGTLGREDASAIPFATCNFGPGCNP